MVNSKIKLYIVDPSSNFIDTIEGTFFDKTDLGIDVIGSSNKISNFEKDKQKIAQTDIFIISANLPDGPGIKIVEFLKKNSVTSSKPIIFTIDKQTRNHATVAKEKGVDKIFQKPLSMKELIKTIYLLSGKIKDENNSKPILERENVSETQKPPSMGNDSRFTPGKVTTPSSPSTSPSPTTFENKYKKIEAHPLLNTREVQASANISASAPKVIVTFTSVSSTGKTSLLVNVAYAIQKYAKIKPKICLVDLNLLFPAIAFHFLNTELKLARRDIYDLSAEINYLNEDMLREALTYHEPSGIYILNTPSEPEFIHKIPTIKSEQIERILVHLRDMFDVILIDTSNVITDDLVLFPMQFSDKNLVVLEPNYLNVVGVNKFFYLLKRLEDEIKEPIISKTHILLNKETKNKSIYSDTARDFLYDKKFIVRIPEDSKFIDFANKGKFIVDSESIASAPILDFANFIYPINPGEEKKKMKLPGINIFKK